MLRLSVISLAIGVPLVLGLPAPTVAQCQSYDFENLAVGTIVTSQYDGVTFSVVGQSCSGSPTIYLRIANQFLGDPFGSKVLLIDGGCPDFSPDYLRMVFDLPQREVRFTLGPWYGTYLVRAYATTSGGSPISSSTITIPGSGFTGCHRLVRVIAAAGDIRRIEIQETNGLWEALDDLAFNLDDTPPTAEITSPGVMSCVNGSVMVSGVACDSDGAYDHDQLEYLRVYPAGGDTWTLISSATTPVCDPGALYVWNTATPAEGLYMLRLTVTNACGLSSSAVTTVYVDKDFDTVTIRQPTGGAIRGGNVCLDGTVWDEFCFGHYVVEYRPAAGGAWRPVEPDVPTYTSSVINDPFATWATAGVIADGDYTLRVTGTTNGGHTLAQSVAVTIDNTPPTAQITQPLACRNITGTVPIMGVASDAHPYEWQLDFYHPTTRTWQGIATGHTSVAGLLATWNTAGLPTCDYTLRLRVWDQSIVDPCGNAQRQYAEDYLAVGVGDVSCPGDINGDGVVDFGDINPFVALLSSTALPIPCP